MHQMPLDLDAPMARLPTENHKKFYDYLAQNYSRFVSRKGDSPAVLKELEEVIYMLLLLILSEDEEPDLETKDGISMLYNTLKVLVQIYNEVLNSISAKDRAKASLLQNPQVHKLLEAHGLDQSTATREDKGTSVPASSSLSTDDFTDHNGDLLNSLGLLNGSGEFGLQIPVQSHLSKDNLTQNIDHLLALHPLDGLDTSQSLHTSGQPKTSSPHTQSDLTSLDLNPGISSMVDLDYLIPQHLQHNLHDPTGADSFLYHDQVADSNPGTTQTHHAHNSEVVPQDFNMNLFNQYFSTHDSSNDFEGALQLQDGAWATPQSTTTSSQGPMRGSTRHQLGLDPRVTLSSQQSGTGNNNNGQHFSGFH